MTDRPVELNLAKPVSASEEIGYHDYEGEQVYYVFHRSSRPRAQILLAGHYYTERTVAYAPWVRWARYLAERDVSALRFDYRGCGESTGDFERLTVTSWLEDTRAMYEFLQAKNPDLPIVLCGIGLGGLFASQLFQAGLGAAMLLWSPAATGADALRDTLLRRLAFDLSKNPATGRATTWSDYMASLERGESIEAAGHVLTPALWREAVKMKLVLPEKGRNAGVDQRGRAWRVTKLGNSEVPLVPGGGMWQALNPGLRMRPFPLNPDFGMFFDEHVNWILSNMNVQFVKS